MFLSKWGLLQLFLHSFVHQASILSMFAKQVVDLHKGILTAVYYPKRLHRHRAFAEKYAANQVRPNSEWLAERVLSFPFRPYLSDAQIDRVCNGLSEALASELKSRL
jgi:dTDP-4-amino-4,6-dideoxygalactose transaminase